MATAPFDITAHELLTGDAAGHDALTSHNRLAEVLLGIHEETVADDDEALILIAIALQVNHQVERGVEANVYLDDSDGDLRFKMRDRLVSPEAAAVVRTVVGNVEEGDFKAIRLR